MKKMAKLVYYLKMLLFIGQFYFVFMMLHNILDTKIYGIVFIIIYLIFAFRILFELVTKQIRYKSDIVYNVMQIGVYFYLILVSFKTSIDKVYVTRMTINYFKINYVILSILIIFIFMYSYLEFKSSEK